MFPLLLAPALGLLQVEHHRTGLLELRLDRQPKLNALNPELVDALHSQVFGRAADADVTGVLLSAAPGRAFCAGGDIREVAALPLEDGKQFLRREYELMLGLAELNCKKPVTALADGLVLGAGFGLFMSAGTRIASSATSFAMPECVLGIVPDTGGTDYLGCLPGRLGRWAGLTGARLPAGIAAAAGLSTHACSDDPAEVEALRSRVIAAAAAGGGAAGHDSLVAALGAEAEASDARAEAGRAELAALEAACSRVFGFASAAAAAGGNAPRCWERGCRLAADAKAEVEGQARAQARAQAAAPPASSTVTCYDRGLQQVRWESSVRIEAKLDAEAAQAKAQGDAAAELWAAEAKAKLARGSPAALVVAYEASQLVLPADPLARRAKALGVELVANHALAALPDFQEGVACAVGAKKGEEPVWSHSSVAEAAADLGVQAILETVRRAEPVCIEGV